MGQPGQVGARQAVPRQNGKYTMGEFLQTILSGQKFLRAKITGGRMPVQMHIRVIDRCNLRCKYCFGDYPMRDLPPPSTEQLCAVLDGLGRLGTKRVTLTGGEPLLREDIHEIVLRARKNHIQVSLTTNGALIDRHPGLLGDLDQLTVSLDGDRSAHNAYRGEGSWEAAVGAIAAGRAAGTPVQLLCTATRLTEPGLPAVFELAERYDCSVTFDLLAPLYESGGAAAPRPEAADDDRIRAILDAALAHPDPRMVFSPYVMRYLRAWPRSYRTYRLFRNQLPEGFQPIPCQAGRFFGLIETNGDLLPCCRTGGEYAPPNVYELGIEEAWRRMPGHTCAACIQTGGNMYNALFALQPATVLHYLSSFLRRPGKKAAE